MKSDREIFDSFKVRIANKNTIDLTYLKPILDDKDDERQSELISESIQQIYDEYPDTTFNAYVDITALDDERERVAIGSQAIYKGITKHPQTGKIAIVGQRAIAPLYMKFIMRLIQTTNRNIKWFTDGTEAREWLNK